MLGNDYQAIAAHLIRRAGLKQATAQTGAVTLVQRFGSALNLNIHFHLLVLDGATSEVMTGWSSGASGHRAGPNSTNS